MRYAARWSCFTPMAAEIVWLVASEHLYNITNLGLNIHSDLLCNIKRKK